MLDIVSRYINALEEGYNKTFVAWKKIQILKTAYKSQNLEKAG